MYRLLEAVLDHTSAVVGELAVGTAVAEELAAGTAAVAGTVVAEEPSVAGIEVVVVGIVAAGRFVDMDLVVAVGRFADMVPVVAGHFVDMNLGAAVAVGPDRSPSSPG